MSDERGIMEWDVALAPHHQGKSHESLLLRLPSPLARALRERGMNRAKITVSEEGLLLRPYAGERPPVRGTVDLPEGWLS